MVLNTFYLIFLPEIRFVIEIIEYTPSGNSKSCTCPDECQILYRNVFCILCELTWRLPMWNLRIQGFVWKGIKFWILLFYSGLSPVRYAWALV